MGFGYVGCSGSQSERVFSYIQKYGVVDSTCNAYEGVERSFTVLGQDCWKQQCRECTSNGNCVMVQGQRWGIKSWGVISGEDEMKYHIYNGGPISCYIYTYVPAYQQYTGGIMSDPAQFESKHNITHVVSLIGYGQDNGTPYWLARNWVGPRWGEDGNFRIFRGNNTLNIESACTYGNPDPDWVPPS